MDFVDVLVHLVSIKFAPATGFLSVAPAKNLKKEYLKSVGRLWIFTPLMILIAISISTTATLANDSTAALGVGGIELVKNDHIRMLKEVLEISVTNVRVKYKFLNESDKDIHTNVAFPLPFYDGVAHANSPIGDPNTVFTTFKALVNSSPVVLQSERKAKLGGRDITDQLRAMGLSDKEIFFNVHPREKGELWSKLQPFKNKVGDWWDISQTIFWEMTFPAGKETAIEHEYEPAAGGGFNIVDTSENLTSSRPDFWSLFTGKDEERAHEDCLDDMTKRAIENRMKIALAQHPESLSVYYNKVEYILGTGRNWKGPIGEFKLRLIKEKPDHFVSVCFPGKPVKINPTTYEFYQKDFVPQDTLIVYFYSVGAKSDTR